MVRGLGLGPALFVAVRKGRSMCGNPQTDRAVRRGAALLAAKWPLYTLRGKSHYAGPGKDQQLASPGSLEARTFIQSFEVTDAACAY
jgi:hypothetical protein